MGSINIGDLILWMRPAYYLTKLTIYKVVATTKEDFTIIGDDGREIYVSAEDYKYYTKIYEV